MPNLSWPMAATIIFAGMPAFVFSVAVVCAYPGIVLPMLGIACAAWDTERSRLATLPSPNVLPPDIRSPPPWLRHHCPIYRLFR
jgi:hypothetical protein